MRLSLLILAWICAACQTDVREEGPLNVLVLYTDDQRFNTIAALGNEEIITPNMDRLVREGTAFTRTFTMGSLRPALCVPSRAMLMTGRPLFGLLNGGGTIPAEHVMMPELLRMAGYRTFATGKWHNDRAAFARAFQTADNIYFGGMHGPSHGGHEAPLLNAFDSTGTYAREDRRSVEGFSSTLYADAAIEFLRQPHDEPFFAYVSFTSPHDPRTPPPPYDSWYSPATVSTPPNFMPVHPFDTGGLRIRGELLREHPRTEQIAREELALYYGMISEVDAQIGRILDVLDETNLRARTLIIFAGDNGLAVGSHGLLAKQSLYDHSLRVPLVFVGPGIPQGETRDALAYIHDVFPTVANVLALELPATAEGHTLLPNIQDANAPSREAVFLLYRNLQRGVRTADNWKLIQYNVNGERTDQLFNLNEDPHEVRNLADDPDHTDRKAAMEAELLRISQLYNDPLDLTEYNWGKQ